MAIIEPKVEERSFKPLIFVAVLFLLLIGIAYGMYAMLSGPKQKTITLSAEDAKKVTSDGPSNIPAGPPLPPAPPLPAAPDPGATMITLDLKNVTAGQVAAELSKQANIAGMMTQSQGDGGFLATLMSKRFDFSVSNKPFWDVMQELCEKGNVYPNMYDNRTPISLQSGDNALLHCPATTVGACRLVLGSVTSRLDADLMGAKPSNKSLTVGLTLFVEPKVQPYRITPIATVETAVDEKGASLIRPRDPWDDRNSGGRRSKCVGQIECRLQFAPNAGDKIAKLKGYCSVIVVGKPETVTIRDPLKAVNSDIKIGDTVVRLRRLSKQGDQSYQAQLTVDANSPLFRDWESLSKICKLVDDKGKAYNSNGNGMGGGQKTIDIYQYFGGNPGLGAPAELQITLPTDVRELRVPFEFADLPLPH